MRRTTPPRCCRFSKAIKSAYRDIAILNAAAALVVAGKAEDLRRALVWLPRRSIRGRARPTLRKLVEVSNRG